MPLQHGSVQNVALAGQRVAYIAAAMLLLQKRSGLG